MNKQKQKKQEREKVQKQARVQITDFVIPIVSGFIFLILLFTLIIPTIGDIRESLDEMDRIEREQEEAKRKLQDLEEIDRIELRNALVEAREVVPYSQEVAEYAYYVDELAQEKDLRFEGMRAQDQFSPGLADIQNIQAVEAPLEYSGTFENVTEFFDRLQIHSPYVISMGEIDFQRIDTLDEDEDEEDRWSFEITVTGYYSPEQDMPVNVRELIDPPFRPYYANNEEVMKIFRDKAEVLEDPDTDMIRPELEEEIDEAEQEESEEEVQEN